MRQTVWNLHLQCTRLEWLDRPSTGPNSGPVDPPSGRSRKARAGRVSDCGLTVVIFHSLGLAIDRLQKYNSVHLLSDGKQGAPVPNQYGDCPECGRLLDAARNALQVVAELHVLRLTTGACGGENLGAAIDIQLDKAIETLNAFLEFLRRHREGHDC